MQRVCILLFAAVTLSGVVALAVDEQPAKSNEMAVETHSVSKRTIEYLEGFASPDITCNAKFDGTIRSNASHPEVVWICQSGRWMPYRIYSLIGVNAYTAAASCKDVVATSKSDGCHLQSQSGAYWLTLEDDCHHANETIQVYCNMDEDGGGWSLVWKHSPMDSSVLPLNDSMKYFSNYSKACTDLEVGWCNIPNKARLNPTEMMIVAYHKKKVVFAYKGTFNWNIDKDWTGGFLENAVKITDNCRQGNEIPPMPKTYSGTEDILGLIFAKRGTYINHKQSYCNDYYQSLSNPGECRWWDCQLPATISSTAQYTQMTMAIYVR